MATIINDNNIHELIKYYFDNRQRLPKDLRKRPLNDWDVSRVTNMERLFYDRNRFNEDIRSWNVSNVTNMDGIFEECRSFNQPLNDWNVSNVTNMMFMFEECRSFNQPLNSWNVSNVTNMYCMFQGCTSFNQPLNDWNVSNVTNMEGMFDLCVSFNQPLNSWNVSNVTNMPVMFEECVSFNQPLNDWNVSNVTNMYSMFGECTSFNQPLNSWDVSNVTDMHIMFKGCTSFNQPLNSWNVSNVTIMRSMFQGCTNFNQNISNWNITIADTGRLQNMYENCGISEENKAIPRQVRPALDMNTGRAYEVHNYFDSLNMDAISNFIMEFNASHVINPKTEGHDEPAVSLFIPLLHFIHNSELFVPSEKTENKQKLIRILGLINGFSRANIPLLRSIIEFVSKQNDEFIEQYIRILSDECMNAYGNNGESCIKGAYERMITTLDAVAVTLTTKDEYRDNEIYNQIKRLFPKMNFVEVVQEWSDIYLEGGPKHNELEEILSNVRRKNHFVEFMQTKYRDAGLLTPIISRKIEEAANEYEQMGVFERLAFGGKRQQKQRRNTKKKGGKQRNTKKKGKSMRKKQSKMNKKSKRKN